METVINASSLRLLDVLLTALGVMLAAVAGIMTVFAVGVAIFGWWGYKDVKRAAVDAAVREVGQYLQMERNSPAMKEGCTTES
ncbi:MAG: hypothetical protein ACYCXX_14690 [Acidiferrobacter thiooxydans]